MNDQEKSILLAKACKFDDLWVRHIPAVLPTDGYHHDQPARTIVRYRNKRGYCYNVDLYSPANMALAWRVHLWQIKQEEKVGSADWPYQSWFDIVKPWLYEDAQRRWLDKIVELVNEDEG